MKTELYKVIFWNRKLQCGRSHRTLYDQTTSTLVFVFMINVFLGHIPPQYA
ncbi:hypothetical protein HanRHA438_Chr16g0742111 [Helianthus annuus]|nr:hypothetical protein HanRHA438_Chr16g0742111 [Helianthus annuus]